MFSNRVKYHLQVLPTICLTSLFNIERVVQKFLLVKTVYLFLRNRGEHQSRQLSGHGSREAAKQEQCIRILYGIILQRYIRKKDVNITIILVLRYIYFRNFNNLLSCLQINKLFTTQYILEQSFPFHKMPFHMSLCLCSLVWSEVSFLREMSL